jgi:Uma2 family endonuclease
MCASVSDISAARRPATYADLLAVPDHLVAEIVDGELFVSPRPALPHARAATRLGVQLGSFDREGADDDAPGGWILLVEPELHLGPDIVVPDLAGWRRSRLPRLPPDANLALAPDWICEMLSPRNTVLDRAKKLPVYAREGVGHAWLIDPIARTLEVYRLTAGRWTLLLTHSGDGAVAAEPFAVAALRAGDWWADVEPSPIGA